MALSGTLESVGVSEIFELLGHQAKTGTLEIEAEGGVARLRFLDGKLIEAWPDRRSPGELIGARLVRADLINEAQLDHALAEQSASLRRLGDILIRAGAVRAADFQQILALQQRETVYRLLTRQRGEFRFVPMPVTLEAGVSVPMEVGALLLEGFRQIDEWPPLRARIPSELTVFRKEPDATIPDDLGPVAQAVLLQVNGHAPVREVVDRARGGDFEGWKGLVELLDRGVVAPLQAPSAPLPPRAQRRSRGVADAAAGLALALAAGALLWLFLPLGPTGAHGLLAAARAARGEAQVLQERAEAWRAPPGG